VIQGFLKGPAVRLSEAPLPPPVDGTALWMGLITLSGLGLVLMACSLLLMLRPWMWLVVSAACVYATNSCLPRTGKPGPLWETVLLAPGLSQHVFVVYPVLPWLGVAALGMYFGYWWKSNPAGQKNVWALGALLLALGIGLRMIGGWGNITLPRDGSWIEFLNNVKYPPSLVFWTMAVGIDLILLGLLMRLPVTGERSPLMVFGQTPLFFYVLHFYLLALIGFVLFPAPGSLLVTYGVWVAVLVMLYPVCAWYRTFKSGRAVESVWRYF
jgi:uncharacterized membrane protein